MIRRRVFAAIAAAAAGLVTYRLTVWTLERDAIATAEFLGDEPPAAP